MAIVPVRREEDMPMAKAVCTQVSIFVSYLGEWQTIRQGYRDRGEPFPLWTQRREMALLDERLTKGEFTPPMSRAPL